jgi:branched-chain amino acid transport system permease protein
MTWVVANILNGLSYGMILFLIASGMSIVMGAMGIINLAHGSLYMIGAYIGWTVAIKLGFTYLPGVVAGGLSAGLVGLLIERGFLRHLYRQLNEQVLLTFGFVYIITNLILWIYTGWPKMPYTAKILSGTFKLFEQTYPVARVTIIIIGLGIATLLWWMQEKTRLGATVRAGMDDKEMTMTLGINLERVFTAVFFGASFTAGVAGVVGAQLMGAYTTQGMEILLLAMIVIIVGGVGSVQGAVLGSIIIGLADAFGRAAFPDMAMFTMYLAMVVVLVIKPTGLIGRGT